MNKPVIMIAASFAVLTLGLPALADCNPACVEPQICRYEASGGGYFYCADPVVRNPNRGREGSGARNPDSNGPTPPGPRAPRVAPSR